MSFPLGCLTGSGLWNRKLCQLHLVGRRHSEDDLAQVRTLELRNIPAGFWGHFLSIHGGEKALNQQRRVLDGIPCDVGAKGLEILKGLGSPADWGHPRMRRRASSWETVSPRASCSTPRSTLARKYSCSIAWPTVRPTRLTSPHSRSRRSHDPARRSTDRTPFHCTEKRSTSPSGHGPLRPSRSARTAPLPRGQAVHTQALRDSADILLPQAPSARSPSASRLACDARRCPIMSPLQQDPSETPAPRDTGPSRVARNRS